MKLRPFLAQWCPPALAQLARSLASRATGAGGVASRTRFEGCYSTWQEAAALSTGYDSPTIFETTRAATLKVRNGEAAFERDSVTFERPDYPLFLISSLLHVAAASGGRLSIMDFGGALGSSYYQCRTFTSGVRDLRWAIVEQPHYVKYGQAELQTDALRFHAAIDDCVRIEKPNVAILSGVLSIVERPYQIVDDIIAHGLEYVIVDRHASRRSPPGYTRAATRSGCSAKVASAPVGPRPTTWSRRRRSSRCRRTWVSCPSGKCCFRAGERVIRVDRRVRSGRL
jgi:putative methyltransferase (TIGR04325 family)